MPGLFGDGVLTRAAELLEQAVALDPHFAEAWVLLADVHQRMGIYLAGTNQTEASATMADCVRKALAIKPDLGQAYGLLGLHEITQNNIVGSLDLAYKGYAVEPNNPAVAVRLGTLLLLCGLTRKGMRYLNEAIDQDPADGRHYMCALPGSSNLGNIDAAIADAQRMRRSWFSIDLVGRRAMPQLAIMIWPSTVTNKPAWMLNNTVPPPSGVARRCRLK